MFYSPKHAHAPKSSSARRRIAGVAVAGATAAVGSVATAQSASASTNNGPWDSVAQCESGGNWSTNTGNGFYGGLQFTTQTWQGFGGDKYAPNAHQATKGQQIEIAQKVLQTQGPGAWPVCSQKAGLTESNGMTGGAPAEEPQQQEQAPQQQEAPEQEAPQQEQEAPEQEAPQQEAPQQEEAPQQQERSSEAQASRSQERATGSLAVDGIFGPNSKAAVEKWVGANADGVLSTDDISALQAKLGVSQDGIVGPETTSALQKVVGADQDGIWGPKTTSALQNHLNAQGL